MSSAVVRSEGPMVLPRAFALMRLLATMPQGLNLSQISTELDVPKSSLSATLKALTEQGFLLRQGTIYHLGSESFALASVILAGRSIRQIAKPYLEKTMEACGETVLLAVLDTDQKHASYVDIVESPKSVRFSVSVGTQRPLYGASCGRLFLAYMSEEDQKNYIDNVKLEAFTDKTITDKKELKKALDRTVAKGVSVTLGDYSQDAGGFSAPIYNSDGRIVAAITIGVPISRGLRETDRFIAEVVSAAEDISRVLGYKRKEDV